MDREEMTRLIELLQAFVAGGAWRGEEMTTVITDVRFENEVAAVKAREGLLVNVEREVSQVRPVSVWPELINEVV